jgi:hypothetical protein
MKLINCIICCFWLLTSVHAQKKYSGLYEGTFMEQKCVLSLKISNGAVVGALYTGRSNSHGLMGSVENGQLNASLRHKMLGNGELIGTFGENDLVGEVHFVNGVTFPIRLEQKSKSLEVDFDKYFGKPSLDLNLVGSWRVLSEINYKNRPVNSHTKRHYFKDGSMQMDGMKLTTKGNPPPPAFRWYTSEEHLYFTMYMDGKATLEIEDGEYKISNDTLTILGTGKFKGGKTVYVKER